MQLSFFETFDFDFDNSNGGAPSNNDNTNMNQQIEQGEKRDEANEKGEEKEKEKAKKSVNQILEEQERSIFFQKTLPFMQHHALEIENLFPAPSSPSSTSPPLSTLTYGGTSELSLHQNQIVCLLAHSFFNTYPFTSVELEERKERGEDEDRGILTKWTYTHMPHEFFQDPNFIRLYYPEQIEVVNFFVHYFNRMASRTGNK
jgi:hypothetical protein